MSLTLDNRAEKDSAKSVIVLGGDGFVGWPTALHLSSKGYQVSMV
jgi:UDP-sulfoquinovose synthase